jgi:predicted nuclease with TOPRIM domain
MDETPNVIDEVFTLEIEVDRLQDHCDRLTGLVVLLTDALKALGNEVDRLRAALDEPAPECPYCAAGFACDCGQWEANRPADRRYEWVPEVGPRPGVFGAGAS